MFTFDNKITRVGYRFNILILLIYELVFFHFPVSPTPSQGQRLDYPLSGINLSPGLSSLLDYPLCWISPF